MTRFSFLPFVLLLGLISNTAAANPPAPEYGTVLLSPCDFSGLNVQEGLIVVPENRAVDSSRAISIHFLRFPAREKSVHAPLFLLPGGPGGFVDVEGAKRAIAKSKQFGLGADIQAFGNDRDLIIVNQRGNDDAPGWHSKGLRWRTRGGPLNEPMSTETISRMSAEGAKTAFEHWRSLGMDLSGYDIINIVDDVNDIRKAFGYGKIALKGGSFGSQWSLAYMKRWPQHVDRALLFGVEPLDHGYDSPQGVWNVFQRLEERLAGHDEVKLPNVGLLGAVKAIVRRLEKEPIEVDLAHPTRKDVSARVAIGVDDFRRLLRAKITGSLRASIETWPKFVVEVYNEDYRAIAAMTIDRRKGSSQLMIGTLIDNSLGISTKRESKLNAEPARRWLGDVNWLYVATRDVTPTPTVDDDFRKFSRSEIPVLLVQGDLDLSTPIENAEELINHLPNGHLIRVVGGTHGTSGEVAVAHPKFVNYLVQFLNADFDKAEPRKLFQEFPDSVPLRPLRFKPTDGPSVYEILTERN